MAHLIDKDAVVAEIERRKANIKEYCLQEGHDARFDVVPEQLSHILSFLDTLEVKEVDLEKELKTLDDTLFDLDGVAIQGATSYLTVNDVKDIAKHFYELGLSVSNKAEKEVQEEPYVMSDTGSYTTTTK